MFLEQDRQNRYRYNFVFPVIMFLLLIISNNIALALDSFPEIFFQNNRSESSEQVIVYLLNFYETGRESALYFSFSAYFTGLADSEPGWHYSGEEDLLELVDLMGPDNSLTVEKYHSLLNGEENYLSWLLTTRDKPARLRLEERHLDRQALELSREKFLYISLIPREISPETGEVFTEIEFSFTGGDAGKQGEGRVKTGLWLKNNSLENVAVVSRRLKTEREEEVQYYILQIAAAPIPAEEFTELNGDLLAIGDIAGLNRLLAGEGYFSRPVSRKLILQWTKDGPGIEFRQYKERFNYRAELNLLSAQDNELDYLFNFNYYLDDYEDLSLSLQLTSERGRVSKSQELPVFRLGFSDQLNWTDNLGIALSYYPIEISEREGRTDLWQLSCLYERGSWQIGYRGELAGKDFAQELSLAYLLDEEKGRMAIIGIDYAREPGFILAYRFNL
ncbi:MAG: hypothetical protein ACHQYO_08420 [Halanaerobiales bacterium]